jgi:hypothetical protein
MELFKILLKHWLSLIKFYHHRIGVINGDKIGSPTILVKPSRGHYISKLLPQEGLLCILSRLGDSSSITKQLNQIPQQNSNNPKIRSPHVVPANPSEPTTGSKHAGKRKGKFRWQMFQKWRLVYHPWRYRFTSRLLHGNRSLLDLFIVEKIKNHIRK